jgi:hypothetical protein
MYDIEQAFKESGLTKKQIEKIKQEVRNDFPDDEMMYELHVIRVLNAIKKGYWSVDAN